MAMILLPNDAAVRTIIGGRTRKFRIADTHIGTNRTGVRGSANNGKRNSGPPCQKLCVELHLCSKGEKRGVSCVGCQNRQSLLLCRVTRIADINRPVVTDHFAGSPVVFFNKPRHASACPLFLIVFRIAHRHLGQENNLYISAYTIHYNDRINCR